MLVEGLLIFLIMSTRGPDRPVSIPECFSSLTSVITFVEIEPMFAQLLPVRGWKI